MTPNEISGKPRKRRERLKQHMLEVRLESGEKDAFKDAAKLAGIPLSAWVRERLRREARRELEEAQRPIAFLKPWPSE